MADIFISYKAERRAAADHLCRTLEGYGYSVWFDYGLLSGKEAFRRQIEREIRAASAVIVLWCPLSDASRWVGEEASLALDLNTYIGVLIEGKEFPFGYREAHNIDFRNWDGNPRSSILDDLLVQISAKTKKRPLLDWERIKSYTNTWEAMGGPSLVDFRLMERNSGDEPLTPLADVKATAKTAGVIPQAQEQVDAKFVDATVNPSSFALIGLRLNTEKLQTVWKERFKKSPAVSISLLLLGVIVALIAIGNDFFSAKPAPTPKAAQAKSTTPVVDRSSEIIDQLTRQCRGDAARSINADKQKCFELGRVYERGEFVDENLDLALSSYRAACPGLELESIKPACARIGVFYGWGMGGLENTQTAEEYLKFSCREGQSDGDVKACGNLGVLYLAKFDGSEKKATGQRYLELACRNGESSGASGACHNLGLYYTQQSPQNLQKALEFHKFACRDGNIEGDAHSCFIVGLNHQNSQEVQNHIKLANDFMRKACREGHFDGFEDACWWLGVNFQSAQGFDQDYAQALRYLEFGCRQGKKSGSALACTAIGSVYSEGLGTEINNEKANEYYAFGCRDGEVGGDATSCFNLGLNYRDGKGVTMNRANSKRYYELGCREGREQGSPSACNNLGYLYEKPTEGPTNYKSAQLYYGYGCRSGDKFGNPLACNNLGMLFYDGRGVEQSYIEALKYFEMACRNGDNGGNHHACFKAGDIHEKKQVPNASQQFAISFYRKAIGLNEYFQAPKDALVRLGVIAPAEKAK